MSRVHGCSLLAAAAALQFLSACGGDETTAPTPQHYSRPAAAQFAVRNGTAINPIGASASGIFDTGPDEAFLEFAIDFPESSPVMANFRVFDFSFGPTDPPTDFTLTVYDANGVANATDYGRGILPRTLTVPRGAVQDFAIDVTAIVDGLRAAGVTHVGLRFNRSTLGQLSVQSNATLEAGP